MPDSADDQLDAMAERLAEVYLVVGPLYRRALRAVEREAPRENLSVGVRAVLDLLRRNGPMTVPQMGRAQSLSRQFVQRMVNEAIDARLVELTDNPAHRRSRLVRLTSEGDAAITALIAREHIMLRAAARDVTEPDVESCLRVLNQMLVALDDIDVD